MASAAERFVVEPEVLFETSRRYRDPPRAPLGVGLFF
jgi:hypothetical protein